MKKSGGVAFSFIFLIVALAFFSSINIVSSSSPGYGDYYVCCVGTDLDGSTIGNCNSVELNSNCVIGSSISNPCYGIEGRKSSETVLQSNSAYYSTGNGLPYACQFGCTTGQKKCFIDGMYEGCIAESSGTETFSSCTGTYANSSAGYCGERVNTQNICSSHTTSSTCDADGDCGWIDGYSSCSGLNEAQCGSTSGCTAQTTCTYSSPPGTYEGTGQVSTCSPGICSNSSIQNAALNETAVCSSFDQSCYVCNTGYTQCPTGPSCKNLNSDELNCGSCGNDCTVQYGADAVCNSGTCGCPVGQSYTQTGTTFESCSGNWNYTSSGYCLDGATGKSIDPCASYNSTQCLGDEMCSWTPGGTYSYSCFYFNEATCSSTTGCTVNTQPVYACTTDNTCSDTDSPTINYTQQGTITANNGILSGTDSCSGNILTEFSCNSSNSGVSSTYDCAAAGGTCSAGACVGIVPPGSLGDCQVGCNIDSDCSSGICRADIGGTNRCVPSVSTCALANTSSCGVAQGTQQCYVDSTGDVKTCTSAGSWSTTTCGGYGCNQTTSTTATCKVPVFSTWWGKSPATPCIYATNPSTASGNQLYALVLRYGTSGIFNILKNGGQINTSAGTLSTCNADSVWVGSWDFLYNSLSPGESANYSFNINSNQSENLTITRGASAQETYCGDGVVQKPNDAGLTEQCDGSDLNGITTCDQYNSTTYSGGNLGCFANGTTNECQYNTSSCQLNSSSLVCDGKSVCGDYGSADLCNADLCRFNGNPLAYNTPPGFGKGKCEWDTQASTCNKIDSIIFNGKEIGYCTSKENSRNDDCSDGFLSYSWNSTWTWDSNNPISAPNGDGSCPTDYLASNGSCHYDPNKDSQNCAPGSATIACPAQVQLSFFDWRNVVAAILIIFVLYVLLMKDKKRKIKKSSKKRKK